MTFHDIKKQIIPTLKKDGVLKASIFGSFARGENTPKSDVDILVELDSEKTLFDLVSLKMALEKKLNKKVDVLTYSSINPLLREIILRDQKIIYEKRSTAI